MAVNSRHDDQGGNDPTNDDQEDEPANLIWMHSPGKCQQKQCNG
jgi:hypothetical protein